MRTSRRRRRHHYYYYYLQLSLPITIATTYQFCNSVVMGLTGRVLLSIHNSIIRIRPFSHVGSNLASSVQTVLLLFLPWHTFPLIYHVYVLPITNKEGKGLKCNNIYCNTQLRLGVTFPPISPNGREIVRTLRNIFPSVIAFIKSDMCFPAKSLKKSEAAKLP